MDQRLSEVLQGKENNYLLPFYWQHGNHHESIPEQIKRIGKMAEAFGIKEMK